MPKYPSRQPLIALLGLLTLIALVLALASCGEPEAACEDRADRVACGESGDCRWRIQSCDGEVQTGCYPSAEAEIEAGCQALEAVECHEQESWNTCGSEACVWVAPGCGLEGDYPLDGLTCIARAECSPEDDTCPDGLECYPYTYDPCAGSDCEACGAHVFGCFPPLED